LAGQNAIPTSMMRAGVNVSDTIFSYCDYGRRGAAPERAAVTRIRLTVIAVTSLVPTQAHKRQE